MYLVASSGSAKPNLAATDTAATRTRLAFSASACLTPAALSSAFSFWRRSVSDNWASPIFLSSFSAVSARLRSAAKAFWRLVVSPSAEAGATGSLPAAGITPVAGGAPAAGPVDPPEGAGGGGRVVPPAQVTVSGITPGPFG